MDKISKAMSHLRLGVNIDHVATLRQARGTNYPDPVRAALIAEKVGVDGITLHLREDRRHVQEHDVWVLRGALKIPMNLECAIAPAMLDFACEVRPQHICLVPEKREELTTEGGLDVIAFRGVIREAVQRLSDLGIRVSLFIDPDPLQIEAAVAVGAPVIEIHTGAYASASNPVRQSREWEAIRDAVDLALSQGLEVHAGHGLHFMNVQSIAALPGLSELNIGHALVSAAVFCGWEQSIRDMMSLIASARG